MKTVICVSASQPQHVPAGNILRKMYYGGFLEKVLSREEYSGYPHKGGEHSLQLKMEPRDLSAFFDLVLERFGTQEGSAEFVASVKARIFSKYPSLQLTF